mmetsp:Transcript_54153/g.118606  ORF Transcript_54153/g.118606 Transcript_54153/m.118606 type:complete len:204 (+) Transcript_54153:632-1243(+)
MSLSDGSGEDSFLARRCKLSSAPAHAACTRRLGLMPWDDLEKPMAGRCNNIGESPRPSSERSVEIVHRLSILGRRRLTNIFRLRRGSVSGSAWALKRFRMSSAKPSGLTNSSKVIRSFPSVSTRGHISSTTHLMRRRFLQSCLGTSLRKAFARPRTTSSRSRTPEPSVSQCLNQPFLSKSRLGHAFPCSWAGACLGCRCFMLS